MVMFYSFFLKEPAPTEIYTYSHTLSLHDSLPISCSPTQDHVDIIVHAAVIFARRPIIDEDQPVGGEFEHIAVVTAQQYRAVKAHQSLQQRLPRIDRKSVAQGKSVSVRVDLGGSRNTINQQK